MSGKTDMSEKWAGCIIALVALIILNGTLGLGISWCVWQIWVLVHPPAAGFWTIFAVVMLLGWLITWLKSFLKS